MVLLTWILDLAFGQTEIIGIRYAKVAAVLRCRLCASPCFLCQDENSLVPESETN